MACNLHIHNWLLKPLIKVFNMYYHWDSWVCNQSQLHTAKMDFCSCSPAIIYLNDSFQHTSSQWALTGHLFLSCYLPLSFLLFSFQKTCVSYWWIVSLQEVSLLSRWAQGLGEHIPDWSPVLPLLPGPAWSSASALAVAPLKKKPIILGN